MRAPRSFEDIMMNPLVQQRHESMINANVMLLEQAVDLLRRITDEQYNASPQCWPGQRIGSHIRHVVEFYESLTTGLRRSYIDYDARNRDKQLESDRSVAIFRLRLLIARLVGNDAPLTDSTLFVRLEEHSVVSSVGRELEALSSHTVHHYGVIAFIARLLDIPIHDEFGFAPSTLKYRASQRSEAA